jgi:hypothetical protein
MTGAWMSFRWKHLDLATVIKVSQAVSGDIVLETLLETLVRTAIEQSGAERGLLIRSSGAEQRIAVEAAISGESVVVNRSEPVNSRSIRPCCQTRCSASSCARTRV